MEKSAHTAEYASLFRGLNALINSSSFFQNDKDKIRKTLGERQALEENLTAAYMRWDELESLTE